MSKVPNKPSSNIQDDEQLFDELNQVSLQYKSRVEQNFKLIDNCQKGFSNQIWRRGALRIVYHISKFIMSLQQNTDTVRFRLLTKKVFSSINDKAADYDYYFFNRLFKLKPTMIQNCFRLILLKTFQYSNFLISKIHLKVFEPDQTFKIIWDICVILVVVSNIFYIPFKIAFTPSNSFISNYIFETLPSLILIFEIFINFNTAFYDEGNINVNHKHIMTHYIRGNFLLDIIVVFPFFLPDYNLDMLTMLRIKRLRVMVNNIEEVLSLRQNYSLIIDLIRLICVLMFVGHFCACMWFYVTKFDVPNTWIEKYNFQFSDLSTQYINSLYWSTITVLTVGYGDIVPQNNIEKTLVIIMSLVTCGVFGYSINSIGQIVKDIDLQKVNQKQTLNKVSQYLTKFNISNSLKIKVLKYFEYLLMIQEEEDEQIFYLMSQLAPELKRQVFIQGFYGILYQSRFLSQNFSEKCIQSLCGVVKHKKMSPSDVLFDKGELCQRIYFLKSGKVSINFENNYSKTRIKKFEAGYVIGEKNFLLGSTMQYKAVANSFADMYFIEKADFIRILQQFPDDYEKYCYLRDEVVLNHKKVISVCEICGSNHQFYTCPFSFYQAKRWKIIQQLITVSQNSRVHHQRRKREKFDLSSLQQSALAICLNDKLLEESELNDKYLEQLGFYEKEFNSSMSISSLNSLMKMSERIIRTSSQQIGSAILKKRHSREQSRKCSAAISERVQLVLEKVNHKAEDYHEEQQLSSNNHSTKQISLFNQQQSIKYELDSATKQSLGLFQKGTQFDYLENLQMPFESMKLYEIYYPSYNFDEILSQVKQQSRAVSSRMMISIIRKVQNSLSRKTQRSFQLVKQLTVLDQ